MSANVCSISKLRKPSPYAKKLSTQIKFYNVYQIYLKGRKEGRKRKIYTLLKSVHCLSLHPPVHYSGVSRVSGGGNLQKTQNICSSMWDFYQLKSHYLVVSSSRNHRQMLRPGMDMAILSSSRICWIWNPTFLAFSSFFSQHWIQPAMWHSKSRNYFLN